MKYLLCSVVFVFFIFFVSCASEDDATQSGECNGHGYLDAMPEDTEVRLDGENLDPSRFVEIGTSKWYRLRMAVDAGAHILEATHRVGLYVYGFSSYVSYAYTAGLDLQQINDQR